MRSSSSGDAPSELLRLVEAEEVQDRQRGEYDLTEEMLRMAESGGRMAEQEAG